MSLSLARIILYLLTGVFVAQMMFYYPNLPDVVAAHFNAAGRADGFLSKQSFMALEAVILLVIIAEFTLLPLVIEKMPNSLINLPNKDYWLADERRAQTFLVIRSYFEWFSILLLALFIAVNQLVFKANLEGQNLPPAAMWLILGAFLVSVTVWLVKFVLQFRLKG